MAITGNEYDHIDFTRNGITTRHALKDATARELISDAVRISNTKITEPSSDGTDGQVLATNGNGGRYWKTVSGGGGGGTSDYTDLENKPSINSITLTGNKSLSDLGIASVSIIDDTAGSSESGKTWSAVKLSAIEQRLADLEYTPLVINTLTVSPNSVEIGSRVTSATLTYSMNKNATHMKLDNEALPDTSASGTISRSALSLTSNKTWTLAAQDARQESFSEWVSKTASITFTNKVKYGVATIPSEINDSFLNGLSTRTLSTGKIRSFSVTAGANQYIWYALPSSYGSCTFTVGGFSGGFTLAKTFTHQNESGGEVQYNVYRSDNANLGTVAVTVS